MYIIENFWLFLTNGSKGAFSFKKTAKRIEKENVGEFKNTRDFRKNHCEDIKNLPEKCNVHHGAHVMRK